MSEEHSERLQLRVPPSFLRAIDEWRRRQPDLPGRSEAIRRLVDHGIKATKKGSDS